MRFHFNTFCISEKQIIYTALTKMLKKMVTYKAYKNTFYKIWLNIKAYKICTLYSVQNCTW